jgi:hypothetical protein
MMTCLSSEGGYWMNSIRIDKDVCLKHEDYFDDIQPRAQLHYNMGLSLGRIVELSNVSNTVYALL